MLGSVNIEKNDYGSEVKIREICIAGENCD